MLLARNYILFLTSCLCLVAFTLGQTIEIKIVDSNEDNFKVQLQCTTNDMTAGTVVVLDIDLSGTANSNDFDNTAITFTFQDSSLSDTIGNFVKVDTIYELDDSFKFRLNSGPFIANIGDEWKITNDDDLIAVVSTNSASENEDDQLYKDRDLKINFSTDIEATILQISFFAPPNYLSLGTDYTTTPIPNINGNLNIIASGDYDIPFFHAISDSIPESDEASLFPIFVQVIFPNGASTPLKDLNRVTYTQNYVTYTLVNDDPISLTVNTVTFNELDTQTKDYVFDITVNPVISNYDVYFRILTVDDSAVAPEDYFSNNQTLIIPANQSNATFTVTVKGDTVVESNEKFKVHLVYGRINDQTTSSMTLNDAFGVINNNDNLKIFFLADTQTLPESTGFVTFTVDLSGVADEPISFTLVTSGTADSGDFSMPIPTQSIPAMIDTATFSTVLKITDDLVFEGTETLILTLTAPMYNNTEFLPYVDIDDTRDIHTITITDNDLYTDFSTFVALGSTEEGNGGSNNLKFQFDFPSIPAYDVIVGFQVVLNNGTGNYATASDFINPISTIYHVTLSGTKTGVVQIPVVADSIYETNESFNLRVVSFSINGEDQNFQPMVDQTNYPFSIDNDDGVVLDFTNCDSTVDETAQTYTCTPTAVASDVGYTLSISYTLGSTNGAINTTSDTYTYTPSAAGAPDITITFTDDTLLDFNEQFSFTITVSDPNIQFKDGVSTSFSPFTKVISVIDNDGPVRVLFNSSSISLAEGESDTTYIIGISLTNGIRLYDAMVEIAFTSGSALLSSDYTTSTTSVTFGAGTTLPTSDITVTIKGDTYLERTENFSIQINNPVWMVSGVPQSDSNKFTIGGTNPIIFTIENDDNPTFTIDTASSASFDELSSATTVYNNQEFTVHTTILPTPGSTLTIDVSVAGTGVKGTNAFDFGTLTTSCSFSSTSSNDCLIVVPVLEDETLEPDEDFIISIQNPTFSDPGSSDNVTLSIGSPSSFTRTINNDDYVDISITPPLYCDEAYSTCLVDFTVSHPCSADITFTAQVTLSNTDPAADQSDFTFSDTNNHTITILAGTKTATTYSIGITTDTNSEPNEHFNVVLGELTVDPNVNISKITIPSTTDFLLLNDESPTLEFHCVSGCSSAEALQDTIRFEINITDGKPVTTTDLSIIYTLTTSTATVSPTGDCSLVSGTLLTAVIPIGSHSVFVEFKVSDDFVVELDETVVINHSSNSANYPTIPSYSSATASIMNDDKAIITSKAATQSVTEDNNPTSNKINVVISSDKNSQEAIMVAYIITPGTATPAVDYSLVSANPVQCDFSISKECPIEIIIIGDNILGQDTESFTVTLDNAKWTTGALNDTSRVDVGSSLVTTIEIDEDDKLELTINLNPNTLTYSEGPGIVTGAVSVNSSIAAEFSISVTIGLVAGGTAISGSDFTFFTTTTRNITTGTKSIDFGTISITDDNLIEQSETFTLTVVTFNASPAITTNITYHSTSDTEITINDNDVLSISIQNDIAKDEGTLSAVDFDFVVEFTGAISDKDINLDFNVASAASNGINDSDLLAPFNSLPTILTNVTIPANSPNYTFKIHVNIDDTVERNEGFIVSITNPKWNNLKPSDAGVSVIIIGASKTGTIQNDDDTTVSFPNDPLPLESIVNQKYLFTLDHPADKIITINLVVLEVEAKFGSDLSFATATVNCDFAIGLTDSNCTITFINDDVYEPTETFKIEITGIEYDNTPGDLSSYLHLPGTNPKSFSIRDDDIWTTLTYTPIALSEGNSGDTPDFTFTFTRDPGYGASEEVIITFMTVDGTGSQPATVADNDYQSSNSLTATFPQGLLTSSVVVKVNGDAKIEQNEVFNIIVTGFSFGGNSITNAPLKDSTYLATINDDDSPMSITWKLPTDTIAEPTSTAYYAPVVTLDKMADADIILYFSVNAQSVLLTTADVGEIGQTLTKTIPANTPAGDFTISDLINLYDDNIVENNEAFKLTLVAYEYRNVNTSLSGDLTVTITNNDQTVVNFVLTSYSNSEGSASTPGSLSVGLTMTKAADADITLEFALSNSAPSGSAYDAEVNDYTVGSSPNIIGLTVKIPAGLKASTIPIDFNGDSVLELNEEFEITISLPSVPAYGSPSLTLGTNTTTVCTIQNDDDIQVGFVPSTQTVMEGQSFTYHLQVTSGSTEDPFTIAISTSGVSSTFTTGPINGDIIPDLNQAVITFPTIAERTGTISARLDRRLEPSEIFKITIDTSELYLNGIKLAANTGIKCTVCEDTVTINEDPSVQLILTSSLPSSQSESIPAYSYSVNVDSSNGTNDLTSDLDITFDFTISATSSTFYNSDANHPDDYTIASTTITILANTPITPTLTLNIINDNYYESSEAFTVTLTQITWNGTPITSNTPTIHFDNTPLAGQITNDDNLVIDFTTCYTSGDDIVVAESVGSLTCTSAKFYSEVDFSVTVSGDFSNTHKDNTSAAGASLTSPASIPNSKTFNKGTNSPDSVIAYTVAVVDDAFLEVGEVAVITLASIAAVPLKNGGTQGTSIIANIQITNNDNLKIGWTVSTDSNLENIVSPTLSVTLSPASLYDVRAEYYTTNAGATSPDDYTGVPTGTSYAVITKGLTTTTVPLTIVNDDLLEADESFKITFQNPQIYKGTTYVAVADGTFTIDKSELVYTITNNDVPTLSIALIAAGDANVPEDVSGSPSTAHYKLITDILPDTTFSVSLSVVGTSSYPAAPGDVSYTISPQTFSSTSAKELPLTVDTVVDSILEGDEAFKVTLDSALYGATFSLFKYGTKEVTTTITDNDAVVIKVPTNLACPEGNVPNTICNLVLQLTGTCQYQITFNAEITTQSRKRAADSSDMTFGNYTITIAPQAPQAIIPVTINGDTISETDEYFTINLSNIVSDPAVQSEISFEAATFDPYILNDEATTLDIYSNSTSEANAEISFLISVTDGDLITGSPLTISYSVTFSAAADSAAAADLTSPVTGTVDMAVGTNQVILKLLVNNEDKVEFDEVFTVTISTASIGVRNNDAIGTLTNDDSAVLSLSTTTPTNSATTTVDEAVVGGTVTLYILSTHPIQPGVTVTITTTDGSATAGQDYDSISGTMNKNFDTSTSQTFTVNIRDDNLVGADIETFKVKISVPLIGGSQDSSRLTIGSSDEVTVSITEDDNTTISVSGTNTVSESAGTVVVSVTATKAFEQSVIVTLTASTNSAGASDYVQSGSRTSSFTALSTSGDQLSFTINDDNLIENTETFTVTIVSSDSTSSHVTLSSTPATITINDNDVIAIRVEPFVAINEGNGNSSTTFNVQLSYSGNAATTDQIITVDVVVDAGATDPVNIGDIVTLETSLPYTVFAFQFPVSNTIKDINFPVTILGDDIVEKFETFTVHILNAKWNGQTIPSVTINTLQDIQTITVKNDDFTVISFPLVVPDPAEDDGVVNTYTLTMTQAADVIVTANVTLRDGSANSGSDYSTTGFPKTVQFQIGSTTSDFFSVTMVDDSYQESDEYFFLDLSSPKYSGSDYLPYVTAVNTPQGSSTIHDDDTITSITIDYTAFTEGNTTGSDTPVTFTVTLPNPADKVINLLMVTSIPTATHTATPVIDYERITTTSPVNLRYEIGETTKTFVLKIVQDPLLEYDESFSVKVHDYLIAGISQTGSPVIGTEKIVVINNDDTLQLSIADSSVVEGAIPRVLVFTITLSQQTTEDILVNVRTVSTGTSLVDATSPSDYIAFGSTQIKIPKNNDKFDVLVTIFDDPIVEENQILQLQIETATLLWNNIPKNEITFINSTATGTILNDDSATVFLTTTTSNAAPTQETAGTPTLLYHVESDFESEIPFTVNFTTTAAGSATPNSDFTVTSGTVTFTAGSKSEDVKVDILNDNIVEDTETVQVSISNLVFTPTTISSAAIQLSSTPADLVALGYIGDSTDSTTISCSPVSGYENDGPLTFVVKLSNPSSATITFTLATADGTGITGAVSSGIYADFSSLSSTITFAPTVLTDQTNNSFVVTLVPDSYYEKDEIFTLTVNTIRRGGAPDGRVTATNAFPGVFSTGTIQNDDTLTIGVSDPSIDEGTGSGSTILNFAVTLNVNTLQTVTFDYATSDATYTAISGSDFSGTSGSSSITVGFKTVDIPVTISRDSTVENDETFQMEISNILWGGESGQFFSEDPIGVGTINNDDTTTVSISFTSGMTIDPEQTGGFTNFVFSLSATNPVDRSMAVTLLLTDVSTDSFDHAPFPTSYTINADSTTSSPITLQIVADNVMEHTETFKLKVNTVSASGIPSANTSASAADTTISIVDDDPITITVQAGFEQDEGNSSTSVFHVPILLSNPTSIQIDVTASTGGGTASTTGAGKDYEPITTVLSFMPDANNIDELFNITVYGDTNLELDETFIVTISNIAGTGLNLPRDAKFPSNAANDAQHVTIKNDDGNVVSINALDIAENGVWTYTVSLVTPIDAITVVTLDLELYTEPGFVGAIAADFTTIPTTVSIPVNETSANVTLVVNNDNIVEAKESFKYKITDAYWGASNRAGLTFSTAGVSYIQNDDNTTLSIQATAFASEGLPNTQTPITITVSFTHPVDISVPIVLTSIDGTATSASNDYQIVSLNAILPTSPATTYTFQTIINGDNVLERDETYNISLAFGGSFSNSFVAIDGNADECVVTIDNDDVLTVSAVSTLSVAEGVANADITLTFSIPSDSNIQVTVTTADGSAIAGSDYTAVPGVTQTLASPTTIFHVLIPILNDNLLETDETFDVDFSNLVYTGGSLGASTDLVFAAGADSTTVTITDSDLLSITIPVGTYQASEGDIINIPVKLSQNTNEAVVVGYQINLSTEPDGSDISPTPLSGTVTIAKNTDLGNLAIQTAEDTIVEIDETFSVSLIGTPTWNGTNINRLSIGTPSSTAATILNDDKTYLSISVVSTNPQDEGSLGGYTTPVSIKVTSQFLSSRAIDCKFNTGLLTNTDIQTQTNINVNIPAGQDTADITVYILADSIVEANEDFTVGISLATWNSVTDTTRVDINVASQTVTIKNDDTLIVSVDDYSHTEGNSGSQTFNFYITLTAQSDIPVVLTYTTVDIDAESTGPHIDYTAVSTPATISVPAFTTVGTYIAITVYGDNTVEFDESFKVDWDLQAGSRASYLLPTTTEAIGTILNDDSATIKFSPATIVSHLENFGGATTAFTYTVTLSKSCEELVSVGISILDDSTEPADYNAPTVTHLDFGSYEVSKTFVVTVVDDDIVEINERFYVVLADDITFDGSATSLVTLGTPSTLGGIILNEDTLTISIDDVTAAEGTGSALTPFIFTITMTKEAGEYISLDVSTISTGEAVALADYIGFDSLNVTFSPGEKTKTLTVNVVQDIILEYDETFSVLMSNLSYSPLCTSCVSFTDNIGLGTINNDDYVSIAIDDFTLNEGSSVGSSSQFSFVVRVTGYAGHVLSVEIATTDHSAISTGAYADYRGVATHAIYFNTSTTVSVTEVVLVYQDVTLEETEDFYVDISNAKFNGATYPTSGYLTISDSRAVGTITNDDSVTVSLSGTTSIVEGNPAIDGPTKTNTFTYTLSNAVEGVVSFNLATSTDGSPPSGNAAADAPADYTAISSTPKTISPYTLSGTFDVITKTDIQVELNETFLINLSLLQKDATTTSNLKFAATNSQTSSFRFTILNDDTYLISVSDPSVVETHSGTITATFVISLSNPIQYNVTFHAATQDGTATTANNDYLAVSGNYQIDAGNTSLSIDVTVNGDTNVEGNETFSLVLSNVLVGGNSYPQLISSAKLVGVCTITTDDFLTAIPDQFYYVQGRVQYNADAAHGILANDQIPNSGLTVTLSAGPYHGNLTLQQDGSFRYTSKDCIDLDTFDYTLSAFGSNSTGTVLITVNPCPLYSTTGHNGQQVFMYSTVGFEWDIPAGKESTAYQIELLDSTNTVVPSSVRDIPVGQNHYSTAFAGGTTGVGPGMWYKVQVREKYSVEFTISVVSPPEIIFTVGRTLQLKCCKP